MFDLQTISHERGLWEAPGSAWMQHQYEFERRSCSITVRQMYDADDYEGIEISCMTDHTSFQHDDLF